MIKNNLKKKNKRTINIVNGGKVCATTIPAQIRITSQPVDSSGFQVAYVGWFVNRHRNETTRVYAPNAKKKTTANRAFSEFVKIDPGFFFIDA